MIGTTLAHYRITGELGAGGMGAVYRATDTKLGREVALKVLPSEMAEDPERLDRFRREAMMLASLDHPGVVGVYSVEESEGRHFLTMQLVEGESLDRVITEGGMAADEVLEIGSEVAEALAAAHDRGIVHRDLKPANVMVAGDGRVKVLDFGLAKVAVPQADGPLDSEMETDLHTRQGVIMGTAPYMSPEQVSGRPVDSRTDVFSLGIMLYEMASGKRPFRGRSTAELGSAILRDTPPSLTTVRAGLPDGLMRVIERCLEKDPESRYPSMREVHSALKAASSGESPSTAEPGKSPAWPKPLMVAAGAAVLAIVAFLLVQLGVFGPDDTGQQAAGGPEIRSIAVLPLDNYSGDPSQDYFAEGMTDALTADLARISRIRVISRGSAMQFGGDNRPSTPEIAEALDVDAIVEGSVFREGDRVRITAQLIDARADRHLWAETFDRSSKDVLALQAEMAAAIAREINVQLTPAEESQLGSSQSVDPEAYDAYLKGRYFFNRPSDENLKMAIERFEDALALSPDFVPALSGLSDAYLWAGYNEGFMTASEARPKARAAAEKAIEIDNASAEGLTSLAVFRHFYEYDWESAEAAYRTAFELNPNYAFAHDQFSLCLAFQGRYKESIAESARAAELDPLNPQIFIDSIFALTWQGDFQGANEQARRAEDLDPTYFFPEFAYGWIDIQAGRVGEAILHLQRSKTMGAPAFASAWLAYAYGASGDRERALAEVEDLTKMSLNGVVTPFENSLVALGLGDYPRAVSLLEQAYALDSQWLGWLKNDRIFDPLRSDPRFATLMKKLNFEE
jgi:TolB-like protein/Tfp pilus assembly protein PilF/predicted Ser/Thr protein kinase